MRSDTLSRPPAVSLRAFEEEFFAGDRDNNLRFATMRTYLHRLGFDERIRGSHHGFCHQNGLRLSLQPRGSACKGYQVREVRKVLRENGMRLQ